MSFRYRKKPVSGGATNYPATIEVFTARTNPPLAYLAPLNWDDPPVHSISNFLTTSFSTRTFDVNSGFTKNLIIFQDNVSTQSVQFDDLLLTSWYSDTKTSNDWTAAESWITDEYDYAFDSGASATRRLSCELDATRDDFENSTNQYLLGPQLTNGTSSVSFRYLRGDNNAVSYKLQWANAAQPDAWLEFSPAISVSFSGAVGQWQLASHTINMTSNMFIRVLHTSGNKGRLFLDEVRFAQFPVGDTWQGDNISVVDSASPPSLIFRGQTGNLNDGFSNTGNPPPTEPKPVLQSPFFSEPIGEISFWYKEHTDGGNPAKLSIQLSDNSIDWVELTSFEATTSGEFLYFSTSVYKTAYSYVRIVNDTSSGDRIAIDDLVVTQPLAAEIVTSNLTISPLAPLDKDTVHATVVLKDLFNNPSNISVRLHYFVGTNDWNSWEDYEGSSIAMSLLSNNPSLRSFFYKTDTPVPGAATRHCCPVLRAGVLERCSQRCPEPQGGTPVREPGLVQPHRLERRSRYGIQRYPLLHRPVGPARRCLDQ